MSVGRLSFSVHDHEAAQAFYAEISTGIQRCDRRFFIKT